MDFALVKKYLAVFLAAGITCLLILTYTNRSYTSLEDELAPYKQCVPTVDELAFHNRCTYHCNKAEDCKSTIEPNYHLRSNFLESTCNMKASSRGAKQRVISFSFYGNISSPRLYFQGIERNAELIRQLYPGWIMRVYHNISEPQARHLLCQTQCSYLDVLDTCFVEDLPGYGNLSGSQPNVWRFLAMTDPLVDVALSRDLDSNLNERELAAVQEWLYYSNASMHVMRDNKYHDTPMLAGMWGLRMNDSTRYEWRVIVERLLLRAKIAGGKGADQKYLREEVWNVSNRPGWVLQHDSYYCEKYNTTGKMLSFPTERLRDETMNFVGARVILNSKPMKVTCPLACRRNPKSIHNLRNSAQH